jgi:hypothetical protein
MTRAGKSETEAVLTMVVLIILQNNLQNNPFI